MVKYLFILKKSLIPDLTRKTDKDDLYSGIRLTYLIKKIYFIIVLKKNIRYFSKKIGKETFLNPFKKYWVKEDYRLPPPYWGKRGHPLTRLWVTIDERINPLDSLKIIPKETLIHQKVKIFNRSFQSKQIASHLFKKHSKFYIINQLN